MNRLRDTVVLPPAGRGSRLELPTPKELLPIGPGRVALDDTLDLLAPHTDRLRHVAALGPDRELPWPRPTHQPPGLRRSAEPIAKASKHEH